MKFIEDFLRLLGKILLDLSTKQKIESLGATEPIPTVAIPLGSGYDNDAWKAQKRIAICNRVRNRIGTPYKLGAEYEPGIDNPTATDCSELVQDCFESEGLSIVDGAVNQYNETRPIKRDPQPADIGFLHYLSHKSNQFVWHVGIRTESGTVIHASMSQGRVVEEAEHQFTERDGWKGWRAHPDLL